MKTLLTLAPVLLLTACVSAGTHVQQSQLAKFQNGVTTRAEVERALGPPQSISTLPDGQSVIGYIGLSGRPTAASFIPIVNVVASGARTTSDAVTLTFDSAGKLTSTSSTSVTVNARAGLLP